MSVEFIVQGEPACAVVGSLYLPYDSPCGWSSVVGVESLADPRAAAP